MTRGEVSSSACCTLQRKRGNFIPNFFFARWPPRPHAPPRRSRYPTKSGRPNPLKSVKGGGREGKTANKCDAVGVEQVLGNHCHAGLVYPRRNDPPRGPLEGQVALGGCGGGLTSQRRTGSIELGNPAEILAKRTVVWVPTIH